MASLGEQAPPGAAEPGDPSSTSAVEARLWQALREIEDPEIPVSLVDMGLIVGLAYLPETHLASLKVTFTAMACPAMEMIQDDIRDRLLREPEVEAVEIEIVWDPVWSRKRLSDAARARIRALGIAV